MKNFTKQLAYDCTLTHTLWQLHAECTEKLYDLWEALYEDGSLEHCQALDQAITELTKLITQCEDLIDAAQLPKSKHFSIRAIFFGGEQGIVRIIPVGIQGKHEDFRDGGMPMHYTAPFINLNADTRLWHERWKSKLEEYRENLESYRKKILPKQPKKLSKAKANELEKMVTRYVWLLGLLRDVWQYTDTHNTVLLKGYAGAHVLEGRVKYNAHTGEVFYGRERASHPKVQSKEGVVWKMLYECRLPMRRASYTKLQSYEREDGKPVFSSLNDSITSDIAKWNSKFAKFGVSVLHKSGNGIALEVTALKR
jgi:hypothetical protein